MSVQKLIAVVLGCVAISAMAGYSELVIAERGKGIASVELPDNPTKVEKYADTVRALLKKGGVL